MDVCLVFLFLNVIEAMSAMSVKGIRMCEIECQFSTSCSAVKFDPVHLRCTLLSAVELSPDGLVLAVKKNSDINNAVTLKCEVIFLDRRGVPVCTPIEPLQIKETRGGVKKMSAPKLLLLPYASNIQQACEIDLKTNVTSVFSISWMNVLAMAVHKSQYIIAFESSILIADPDGGKQSAIKSGIFRDMHVDERKSWIFYKEIKDETILARVRVNGKKYRKVFAKKLYSEWFFVLDRKGEMIYLYTKFEKSITLLSYDGSTKATVQLQREADAMVVDPLSGVLYFTSRAEFCSLKDNKETVIEILKSLPLGIVNKFQFVQVHNGILYLVAEKKNEWLFTFRVSDKKFTSVRLPSSGRSGLLLVLVLSV